MKNKSNFQFLIRLFILGLGLLLGVLELSGCSQKQPKVIHVQPEVYVNKDIIGESTLTLLEIYKKNLSFWKSKPRIAILSDSTDTLRFQGCPTGTGNLIFEEVVHHPLPVVLLPPKKPTEEEDLLKDMSFRQQWLLDHVLPSLSDKKKADGLLWAWCETQRNYQDNRVDMYLNMHIYSLDDEALGKEMAHTRSKAYAPPESAPTVRIKANMPKSWTIHAGEELRLRGYATDKYSGWITKYSWNFGDPGSTDGSADCADSTVTGEEACHKFSRPGEYNISLAVTDNEGMMERAEMIVNVEDFHKPTAAILSPKSQDSLYTCQEITFKGAGESKYKDQPVSVHWDFGDGGKKSRKDRGGCCQKVEPDVHLQTPYCYEKPGNYTVTFTVKDTNKATQVSRNIKILEPRKLRVTILQPVDGAVFDHKATIPFKGMVAMDAIRNQIKPTLKLGSREITAIKISPPEIKAEWKNFTLSGRIQLQEYETGPFDLTLQASDGVKSSLPVVTNIHVKSKDETEMNKVGFKDPVIGYEVVEVARPADLGGHFWIGRYEVSAKQWRKVMSEKTSSENCNLSDQMPATCVSWETALKFVEKINKHLHSANSRRRYRLPEESEWEYACKAGGNLEYGFKEELKPAMANFRMEGQDAKKPRKVNDFVHNAVGVSAMHGNVMEWVHPYNPEKVKKNINKGGGWVTNKRGIRCSHRNFIEKADRYEPYFGLRLVAEIYTIYK